MRRKKFVNCSTKTAWLLLPATSATTSSRKNGPKLSKLRKLLATAISFVPGSTKNSAPGPTDGSVQRISSTKPAKKAKKPASKSATTITPSNFSQPILSAANFLTIFFSPKRIPNSSPWRWRSEEHTSELQSLTNLVCRLLLEKKNVQGILRN